MNFRFATGLVVLAQALNLVSADELADQKEKGKKFIEENLG